MTRVSTKLVSAALAVSAALHGHTLAQCDPYEGVRLIASDGRRDDSFGAAICVLGDRMVIGAPHGTFGDPGPGSAYVYRRVGGGWTEWAHLSARSGNEMDTFGNAVSLDGEWLAVGAMAADDLGYDVGAVHLYRLLDDHWPEWQTVYPSDPEERGVFGRVSLSGGRLAVGSQLKDGAAKDSGAVYIFDFDGAEWIQTRILTPSTVFEDDSFGQRVELEGNRLAVACPNTPQSGDNTPGRAYIFEWDGSAWRETAEIWDDEPSEYEQFATDISLDGDVLAVGDYNDNDQGPGAGAVSIFQLSGGAWLQTHKLYPHDPGWGRRFGVGLALAGDRLVVGDIWDDEAGADAGAAYFFERIDGAWIEAAKVWPPDVEEEDGFGRFLDYDGRRAVIANFRDDNENGINAGSVWMYDFSCLDECEADFDGDGQVDIRDFIAFLDAWAQRLPGADANGDGVIDSRDFVYFLNAWAAGCP